MRTIRCIRSLLNGVLLATVLSSQAENGGLLATVLSRHAAPEPSLLADCFDGKALDATLWSAQKGGSGKLPVVDGSGNLFADAGPGGSHRSFIVSKESNFDFFSQPLTVELSDIALAGNPGNKTVSAYVVVGRTTDDELKNYFTSPRWYEGALIVQLQKNASGVDIALRLAQFGSGSVLRTFALNGMPADLILTFDGATKSYEFTVSGTTFAASGQTSISGQLEPLDVICFTVNGSVFSRLVVGAIDGVDDGAKLTLGSIKVNRGTGISEAATSATAPPSKAPGRNAFPLSITAERDVAIYDPKEPMGLQLVLGEGLENEQNMSYSVILSKSVNEQPGEILPQGTVTGEIKIAAETNLFPIHLSAPAEEGVYWAKVTVDTLSSQAISSTAQMQFVVIDPDLDLQAPGKLQAVLVKEIDCAEVPDQDAYIDDGETRVVAKANLGNFRVTGTLGKNFHGPSNNPTNITRDHISWFAYRIEVKNPGVAHRIDITYPDDDLRSMGVYLYEPSKVNELRGVQIFAGIITGGDFPNSNTVKTHGVYFWPQDDHVIVLIANRLHGKSAAIGKICLYELPDGLPRAEMTFPEGPQRRIGLYYEEARLPENFGGQYGPVGERKGSHRGWEFFYKSAKNMAEYMRFNGMNSLLYLSFGYFDSIYPTKFMPEDRPSRYDRQLASDPFRKDVLELYLRILDRDGSVFIPNIKFFGLSAVFEDRMEAAKIPECEYRCYNSQGIQGSVRTRGPVYDPLSPHWQSYVREVIEEIANRYKTSRAFTGVDLRVVKWATGIIYPDIEWGYGDGIIAAFERDTGIKLPGTPDDPNRFAMRRETLRGKLKDTFLAWRESRIAAFLETIASDLAVIRSDLNLYVSMYPGTSIPDVRFREAAEVMEQPNWNAMEYRRGLGVDLSQWSGITNLVLLPYRRDGGHFLYQTVSLNRPAHWLKEEDMNPDWLSPYHDQRGMTGTVSYYTYFETRLDDFAIKAREKWNYNWTQVWIVGNHVPTEPFQLEPYARAMNNFNACQLFWGGFHAPTGRDEDLRRFAKAYRALPAVPFKKSTLSVQPVGLHTAVVNGKSYAYLVNESFASAEVSLTLSGPQAQTLFSEPDSGTHELKNGQVTMRFSIHPYSLVALWLDQGPLEVQSMTVDAGSFYTESLRRRTAEINRTLQDVNTADSDAVTERLTQLLNEKHWIELWGTIHSGNVYNLITGGYHPERSQGRTYFGMEDSK